MQTGCAIEQHHIAGLHPTLNLGCQQCGLANSTLASHQQPAVVASLKLHQLLVEVGAGDGNLPDVFAASNEPVH